VRPGDILGSSKIEIEDELSANSGRELCNLGERLLALGILGDGCLQCLMSSLVVLYNDESIATIWAGFKSAKTIDDPVLEVGRFQLLSYGCYNVDGAATVVRDG
jgi:hypothetical protein